MLTAYSRGQKMRRVHSFADAEDLADALGRTIGKMLDKTDYMDVTAAEIEATLLPVMKRAFGDASRATAAVQQAQLKALGLGVNALQADFDATALQQISEALVGRTVEQSYIENLLARRILQAVDDTIRKNAEANDEMGLKVHIKRTYSNWGLKHGTKYAEDCEWCKSRCGEWTDVRQAIADGCFERHDGCLCIIDYDVERTHTWSASKGNWKNK